MSSQASVCPQGGGGMCDEGAHAWQGGGHVWQRGACMVKEGVIGKGAWMVKGGMRGRGCMAVGAGVVGGGCMAGETATATNCMHPTGMHSCTSCMCKTSGIYTVRKSVTYV